MRRTSPTYLGPPRFRGETAFRTSRPGVATGLAWTETGGDVLFIEAVLLPGGGGQLTLTGQLGSVMQESARAALSHVRQQARALQLSPEFLGKQDLHVHVPAGAIPKDGPSAGVTMATAIVSAARGVPVSADVAMTGEITLSGLVLPVGGIREKALAARRYGIKTIILPQLNEPDLAELPEDVRHDMTFVPVKTLEEALAVALPGPRSRPTSPRATAGADAAPTSAAPPGARLGPCELGRLLHLRPRLRPRVAPDRDHQRAGAPARPRARACSSGRRAATGCSTAPCAPGDPAPLRVRHRRRRSSTACVSTRSATARTAAAFYARFAAARGRRGRAAPRRTASGSSSRMRLRWPAPRPPRPASRRS